jgi:hypothetical protein
MTTGGSVDESSRDLRCCLTGCYSINPLARNAVASRPIPSVISSAVL